MLRAGGVRRDIRQVDGGARHAGQLDLRLLGSFLQTLHGDLIAGEVDALGLLELGNKVIDNALIEIIAAEVGVAVRGKDLDDTVADVQNGDIERAAAQIIDHDLLRGFLIDTVGQCSGRRLVDDTLDLQAGDLACILRGLTLGVVEVSRDGDDRFGHGLAQVSLSIRLQLAQDHCGDLLRGVLLAVDVDLIIGAHVALDRGDRAVCVRNGLTLCDLTDHTLTGLRECNNGRSGAIAFGIRDNDGLAAFHHGDTGIRRAKINTNNFSHNSNPPKEVTSACQKNPFGIFRQAAFRIAKQIFVVLFCNSAAAAGY